MTVKWFRILEQCLHEILKYSFNVEINWIKCVHMWDCLLTSIFLIQSKFVIFLWVLLMMLSSTKIYFHHCWNWTLIREIYSTYSLFFLNIRKEVSCWISSTASWRTHFLLAKFWWLIVESWFLNWLKWTLLKLNWDAIEKVDSFAVDCSLILSIDFSSSTSDDS